MKKIILLICTCFLTTSLFAQIINIPDPNFKAALLSASGASSCAGGGSYQIDTNNNGEIEVSEALEVCRLQVTNSDIYDMTGIEYFTNLEKLFCYNNSITEFNAPSLENLETLSIANNLLTEINLTGLDNLGYLSITSNQLTSLDISGSSSMRVLQCGNNLLTSIDLNQSLRSLYCGNNLLTSLNLNPSIVNLECNNNLLETLDLSELSNLYQLDCSSNNLESLFMKNGAIENQYFVDFSNNNDLQYVCADTEQLQVIEEKIIEYEYNNCFANSICAFILGEDFYTVQGNTKFDENEDGCTPVDINFPNMLLTFSDGTNSGDALTDLNGAYHYPIQAGTYTITPQVSNPAYFSVFPTTVSVTLPSPMIPFVQDFCIEPNGQHPDLTIISSSFVDAAFPGGVESYVLKFSNKGTSTQSGSVEFNFDDDVMDYVSSTPPITNTGANLLIWDFVDLQPFETREIAVMLYVHSPSDVPPLTDGDILDFTVSVIPSEIDETPEDNTFSVSQLVSSVVLNSTDFSFSDYFSLYPNPANHFLNLVLKTEIDIKMIEIYDVSGRSVRIIDANQDSSTINVSSLVTGNYFMKILTDRGIFNTRFIKK